MIQIRLHNNQYEIATDPSRFKVVCAGRRFGKSVLSRAIILNWASNIKNGLFWIVSPTYQMGKDIHWKQGLNIEIPSSWIAKKNEADFEIILKNGSRIALRSAENPDRLRGVKLNGLIIDECAFIQKWDEVWKNALRPSLTDTQAPAVFISTPQGYNHFYDLYLLGQKGEKDWKSWKFTTYDNPFIQKEEIEKAKRELDEDAFAQEYLAEFKKFTGLVIKNFQRETHVIEPTELPQDATYYRSIDFGFVNPTAVIFAYINNKGELIVYDEIYQKGLQTPDLANLILQKSAGRQFSGTFADSSQASDIAELQKYGIDVLPVKKTSGTEEDWTMYKIRRLVEKIKTNQLKITKNCVNLIWEIENYRYHEINKNGIIREIPLKLNDHCHDEETMILTKNGWKFFKDLKKDDFLLTVNLKNRRFEWQKPIKIIKKRYKGEMLLCEKKHTNFCVTPDHNFVFNRQFYVKKHINKFFLGSITSYNFNKFWIPSPEVFYYPCGFNNNHAEYITIPRVKRSREPKVPSSTGFYKLNRGDFCFFLGLWLSEGSLSKSHYQVTIDQSIKSKFYKTINDFMIFLKEKYKFNVYSWINKKTKVKRWSILSKSLFYFLKQYKGKNKGEKLIPKFIWNYHPKFLKRLFDGLMMGDGCYSYKTWHFDTVSKDLALDFVKLCVLLGMSVKLSSYLPYRKTKQKSYRIWIKKSKKSKYMNINIKKDIKKIFYDGIVYCATVPNKTLITMRKGCILISGNCIDALTYLICSLPEEIEVKILNDQNYENWIRELPEDKLFKDGFF